MIKKTSQMLAIPAREEDLKQLDDMMKRLEGAAGFNVISTDFNDETLELEVDYIDDIYKVQVYPISFQLPEFYRCQHLFPDVDIEALQEAEMGLAVEMEFGDEALPSYHLQLKVIHTMLPDALAVLDDSSEKILSGHWVALAAESGVLPAPRYIYTAQAVSGDDDCVWLHTHGLNRCGLPELEVLNSNKETYQFHYNVLETLANRLLELEEPLEPKEPFYLARLTQDEALMITLVDWEEAVALYDINMLGGTVDRADGHNEDTCAIFVYPSEEAYNKGEYEPLMIYDELLKGNAIYMISNAETQRMKELAAERLGYMISALEHGDCHILVKLGLTIDLQHRTENNQYEHIWFELLKAEGDRIWAKLTQEPYYIAGLHVGDEGWYTLKEITDWIIYTPERRIMPDDVYLLEIAFK